MLTAKIPHDPECFTQGIIYDKRTDTFIESSGLYGKSDLRKTDKQGRILKRYRLPDEYFAEGITIKGNNIFQLTWKEHKIFMYDIDTFERGPIKTFEWDKEGWGITFNGRHMIISDGTNKLYFTDPNTFDVLRILDVRDGNKSVNYLNALAWYNGNIYANVFMEQSIYIIDPFNGIVIKKMDISNFTPPISNNSVPNGITFDSGKKLMYVTGKLWNKIYEIKIL